MPNSPRPSNPARRLDEAGMSLVLVMVVAAILMVVIGGVLSKSVTQQKVGRTRQTNQDFRQAMSALYLMFNSPTACARMIGSRSPSGGAVFSGGESVLGGGVDLEIPGRGRLQAGGRMLGVKVEKVWLALGDRVGTDPGIGGGSPREVHVAYLTARTLNEKGMGALARDYRIPLTVFLDGRRVDSCNTSDGLIDFDAYFNPGAAGSAKFRVSLETRAVSKAVGRGESGKAECERSEFVAGVAYRFRDADDASYKNAYKNVYPVRSDTFSDDTGLTGGGADAEIGGKMPRVRVDANPVPGAKPSCEAHGGETGFGAECIVYCTRVVKR